MCACLVALQWSQRPALTDAMMVCQVLVLVLQVGTVMDSCWVRMTDDDSAAMRVVVIDEYDASACARCWSSLPCRWGYVTRHALDISLHAATPKRPMRAQHEGTTTMIPVCVRLFLTALAVAAAAAGCLYAADSGAARHGARARGGGDQAAPQPSHTGHGRDRGRLWHWHRRWQQRRQRAWGRGQTQARGGCVSVRHEPGMR